MTLRNHFQFAAFISEAFWMGKVKASDILQWINALQQTFATVISECFDENLLPLADFDEILDWVLNFIAYSPVMS